MKNTNKLMVTLLALAVIVSSFAVTTLTTSAAEGEPGITATIYRPELVEGNFIGAEGEDLLVEDAYGAQCGYDNVKQFDDTIEALLDKTMVLSTAEDVTSIAVGNSDNYIMKWTGTMTAKESGTYTLIGRKIDNGFVMKVDGEKVYEYWGASHWFDGADDRLVSDEGTFTVEAGKSYNVEIYFLELGGGDALEIWATTTPDDTNSGANINDAFTWDLTQQTCGLADGGNWANYANDVLVTVPEVNGNGGQCENAALYEESIEKLKGAFTVVENIVVNNFSEAVAEYDGNTAYVVVYKGTLTPKTSGEYTFGAATIDNGFYLNIDGTVAYEFWGGRTWNDDGSGNTYTSSVTLEAGKEYPFTAAFLETDGGQTLKLVASIDGAENVIVCGAGEGEENADLFTFKQGTIEVEDTVKDDDNNNNNGGNNGGDSSSDNSKTGDVASVATILVAGVAAMGGLKLRKKSK